SYSPDKAAALWERFRRNGTWVVPTLYSISKLAPQHIAPEMQANDAQLELVPQTLRKQWNPLAPENQVSEEDGQWWTRQLANDTKLTREMHRAGVAMLAGSDSLDRFVFAGSSLHGEMESLERAGFTPMEALQAATRDAARFLGRENELGTIAPGLRADMVLLDADPLKTIRNTTKIFAVVRAGAYLDRAALDALLLEAKDAAKSASVKE
ncbi:MAG: amidohydrolase, partial [Proteobacteria bacterium]